MDTKTHSVLEFDKIRRRLAEHTAFGGGRRLALELAPAFGAAEVRRRMALVAESGECIDRNGRLPMGGAHDMRPEVEAAERGRVLLPAELVDIADTLRAAGLSRRAVVRDAARWPGLAEIAISLDECPALADALRETLDDEGHVLDGASPALRKIRASRRSVHDRLLRQLSTLVSKSGARAYLQEALITQRAGRYVVPVKADFRARVPGVVHDTSDSGATLFIEPLALVEVGNRHRELEIQEEKEVARILRELSSLVAAEAGSLRDTIGALADLDLFFAAADYGHATRSVVPEIRDGRPRLVYERARHPLLDPETVVPIDVSVGETFRVLVITGPNTGGKTLALKTIGLLTLMAQAGVPIPCAEGSYLAVFDGVYADIGDEQSIEQSLSTFSGHLTSIVRMLDEATAESLVILDELGAGTDPTEGAALAVAILEALRGRDAATVASTHYSELKSYAHSTPGVTNASVEFDLATLSPTYELNIGLPGRSNALAIATRLGLPDGIVAAAREGIGQDRVSLEEMLASIHTATHEAAADRAQALTTRAQADEWATKLDMALLGLEADRVTILREAREQAAAELEVARKVAARLEAAARAAGQLEVAAQVSLVAEQAVAAARGAAALASIRSEPRQGPTALNRGDRVRVAGVGQEGEVLELRNDGRVEVALGNVRLTVALSELSPVITGQSASTEAQAQGREVPPRVARAYVPGAAPRKGAKGETGAPKAALLEVDLRGMRVDEALEMLDRHLDRALVVGAPWVNVIHGHGTGAMKKAVRDALALHAEVASYRPGERGEGGDGATIVTLR